jgi:hypothetical protein
MSGIERNETTFFHADKNNATKESVISTEVAHGAIVRHQPQPQLLLQCLKRRRPASVPARKSASHSVSPAGL